ncbi:MAG: hypothetical protein RMA76_42930 [Deltaproteobacteria bacterium]
MTVREQGNGIISYEVGVDPFEHNDETVGFVPGVGSLFAPTGPKSRIDAGGIFPRPDRYIENPINRRWMSATLVRDFKSFSDVRKADARIEAKGFIVSGEASFEYRKHVEKTTSSVSFVLEVQNDSIVKAADTAAGPDLLKLVGSITKPTKAGKDDLATYLNAERSDGFTHFVSSITYGSRLTIIVDVDASTASNTRFYKGGVRASYKGFTANANLSRDVKDVLNMGRASLRVRSYGLKKADILSHVRTALESSGNFSIMAAALQGIVADLSGENGSVVEYTVAPLRDRFPSVLTANTNVVESGAFERPPYEILSLADEMALQLARRAECHRLLLLSRRAGLAASYTDAEWDGIREGAKKIDANITMIQDEARKPEGMRGADTLRSELKDIDPVPKMKVIVPEPIEQSRPPGKTDRSGSSKYGRVDYVLHHDSFQIPVPIYGVDTNLEVADLVIALAQHPIKIQHFDRYLSNLGVGASHASYVEYNAASAMYQRQTVDIVDSNGRTYKHRPQGADLIVEDIPLTPDSALTPTGRLIRLTFQFWAKGGPIFASVVDSLHLKFSWRESRVDD